MLSIFFPLFFALFFVFVVVACITAAAKGVLLSVQCVFGLNQRVSIPWECMFNDFFCGRGVVACFVGVLSQLVVSSVPYPMEKPVFLADSTARWHGLRHVSVTPPLLSEYYCKRGYR